MGFLQEDEAAIKAIATLIDNATNIVITCHVSPDGDAIGSSLALWEVLRQKGKKVTVITPDLMPATLRFVPGSRYIITASSTPDKATMLLNEAHLIFCLDFNDPKRIDRLEPVVMNAPAPKVLIDHHLNPADFAVVTISHPEVPATCALLFMVLKSLGYDALINWQVASCLYTGILTDTGGLAYNCSHPSLYIIIAELLERGFDRDRIFNELFRTKTLSSLRTSGFALGEKMEVFPEYGASLITLTYDELQRFGYTRGDTEGLVNVPLEVPGIYCSIYLREDKPGFVKVSTRSRGDYPVNVLCSRYYGGGGHLNAAGGEFYGSMQEAVNISMQAMQQMATYLPGKNTNSRK